MARTITATERAAIAGRRLACFGKIEITDSLGAYVDYSTGLLGVDYFDALTLSDDIDANSMSLSGSLTRCVGTASLAPFMASSSLNLTTGSYATKLDLYRSWKVAVAVMREGYAPTGTDWKYIGQGRVDVIDVGSEQIRITGRSDEAVLLDTWIQTEKSYGSVGGIAMETVIQSMLDDNLGAGVVTLYTPVSPGYLMNAWTQQKGSLMVAIQDVAAKAGYKIRYRYDASDVWRLTLYKPDRTASSELWTIGPSEYTAVPLNKIDISGIRNFIKLRYVDATLGTQTVIYPHMAGTGTLTCVAGVGTFSSSQAGIVRADSRTNVIVGGISYTISGFNGTTGCVVSSQLATGGVPTFGASAFTLHDTLSGAGSTTSLTRFGRRDIEIDLVFTSQVNTSAKAQPMADAIGSDMEFPNLEQRFDGIGWWFIQLHDYGKFLANGIHYDSDQLGGVSSISVNLANGTANWNIGARGKPSGAYVQWRVLGDRSSPRHAIEQKALRDTQPISIRTKRVSETTDQIVVRVEAISPNAAQNVSVAYDNGGLTVSPASPQTLAATTDFATTPHVDFTITRDTQGGTPRRVAFTGSATNYVDGTDAVDVPPNSNRFRCKVTKSANQTGIVTGTNTALTWDQESYDTGSLHDNVTANSRITIPTGGNTGIWLISAQVEWDNDGTGIRQIYINKNGATRLGETVGPCAGGSVDTVQSAIAWDDAPAVGDYYEVFVQHTSGVNRSVTASKSFFAIAHLW